MYLALSATAMEMKAFDKAAAGIDCHRLVTGLGLVETTLRLADWLRDRKEERTSIAGVINFGIAGAYLHNGGAQTAGLLDICLATDEVLGDLGICLHSKIEHFSADNLGLQQSFVLDRTLRIRGERALEQAKTLCKSGRFVTVQCVSGTEQRGNMLGEACEGMCETMEGAAVARVCREFAVPVLEVRCVSNLVEDRNVQNWKLRQACNRAGQAAAVIIRALAARS